MAQPIDGQLEQKHKLTHTRTHSHTVCAQLTIVGGAKGCLSGRGRQKAGSRRGEGVVSLAHCAGVARASSSSEATTINLIN